jgi:hypothetical protein
VLSGINYLNPTGQSAPQKAKRPMTDVEQFNSAQTEVRPLSSIAAISPRYLTYILTAAILILGLVGTFAWVAFLGWGVFFLVRG